MVLAATNEVIWVEIGLVRDIIRSIPITQLRSHIAKSKLWRDTVCRGFRPHAITTREVLLCLTPALVKDAEVEQDLISLWREAHGELVADVEAADFAKEKSRLLERWPAELLRIALVIAGRIDTDEILEQLDEQIGHAPSSFVLTVEDESLGHDAVKIRQLESTVRTLKNKLRRLARRNNALQKKLARTQEEVTRLSGRVKQDAHARRAADRKVQELTEALLLAEEQLRVCQASSLQEMAGLGVVVIPYNDLGPDPRTRLSVLADVRVVLAASEGDLVPVSGGLADLVQMGHMAPFWIAHEIGNQVEVRRKPNEHILLGTSTLMEDIYELQHLITS